MLPSNTAPIDVIIPLFNMERFILRALQSVEKQSVLPRRIIVVDDGSTDHSASLVKSYDCAVPLLYLYQSNSGPNAARNRGLDAGHSPFVALLDADDEWMPSKLAQQLNVFTRSKYPNLGVVYGDYLMIDEHSEALPDHPTVSPRLRGNIFDALLPANTISGSASSVLIRRACFDVVGRFDENLRIGEDWDMWLRLSEHYDFDYVREPITRIRLHPTNTQSRLTYSVEHHVQFYNKWCLRVPPSHPCLREWRRTLRNYIRHASYRYDIIALIESGLGKPAKLILFRSTNGSLRMYVYALVMCDCLKDVGRAVRRPFARLLLACKTAFFQRAYFRR